MKPLALIGNVARWGVRKALCFYYPRIEIEGRERVPKTGAVLFVANHPNSLMDPALIGYTVGRPVHFFAKAPLFDVPVFGSLMSALGMVPAYRGQDDKAQVRKNLETLDVGAKYLQKGEAVGIFPEGKTHDREGVEQVRSGAARIASAAVQGGAAFVIVPLGLNYERKERFRSSIWVRVGEPIDAAKIFRDLPDEERKAMRVLTEKIDSQLKQVVIHLQEDRWQPMLDELDVLLPATVEEKSDPISNLRQRKRLADAINYFLANDRSRAEEMTAATEQHRTQLAAHGLTISSASVRMSGPALAWKLTKEIPGPVAIHRGNIASHRAVPDYPHYRALHQVPRTRDHGAKSFDDWHSDLRIVVCRCVGIYRAPSRCMVCVALDGAHAICRSRSAALRLARQARGPGVVERTANANVSTGVAAIAQGASRFAQPA